VRLPFRRYLSAWAAIPAVRRIEFHDLIRFLRAGQLGKYVVASARPIPATRRDCGRLPACVADSVAGQRQVEHDQFVFAGSLPSAYFLRFLAIPELDPVEPLAGSSSDDPCVA
jgi:hypothetical protein